MDIVDLCLSYRIKLGYDTGMPNEGELAAYIAYSQAFPSRFVALVDTYDSLKVGLVCCSADPCALCKPGLLCWT